MLLPLIALFAATTTAWEGKVTPNLYSATFDTYAQGETLSQKGAKGGSWDGVSVHAEAKAKCAGETMCMAVATDSTGLSFVPENFGDKGPKVIQTKFLSEAAQYLPTLDATAKAGFVIYAPPGEPLTFQGWSATQSKWLELVSDQATPQTNTVNYVSIWVVEAHNHKIRVQYRLKSGEDYVTLRSKESGAEWFDAGVEDDTNPTKVDLLGSGTVENLLGRDLPSPGVSVSFR